MNGKIKLQYLRIFLYGGEEKMKEKSYMLAVPTAVGFDLDQIHKRLQETKKFQLLDMNMKEDGILCFTIEYQNTTRLFEIYPAIFEIPLLYRSQHLFPDIDLTKLEQVTEGLAVEMFFGENALMDYHLQLQVIDVLLPDKLAVLDDSSEKILSGKWVALAAASNIPPAPRYLYTVQAVSSEEGSIWLHTHGLNRCGLSELEILNSSKEMYQTHYTIIETMANRMLELDHPLALKEAFYLAQLADDIHMVTTLVSWEEAVLHYDENMLGAKADRENGHNGNTSAIFVYSSQEAYENKQYMPVMIYDEILKVNPVYYVSLSETNRMKTLAAERLSYLKYAVNHLKVPAMVKLGIPIDSEFGMNENEEKEHIWFELLEITDERIQAKLTQKPYFVSGLHKGDIGEYTLSHITDWFVIVSEKKITPDDVYLFEIFTNN